jgi:hypothetical protein
MPPITVERAAVRSEDQLLFVNRKLGLEALHLARGDRPIRELREHQITADVASHVVR